VTDLSAPTARNSGCAGCRSTPGVQEPPWVPQRQRFAKLTREHLTGARILRTLAPEEPSRCI
jgi:hypothetical protein